MVVVAYVVVRTYAVVFAFAVRTSTYANPTVAYSKETAAHVILNRRFNHWNLNF